MVQPLWRIVWWFLKKLKTELPYDSAIPILGIYSKKNMIQKDSCTPMFMVSVLTIAKTWKHPKCPSTEEWIKKMWYIYTREYSVQFSSVAVACLTLCNPMNRNTPGFPVHHQLPEFTHTHVH